MSEVSQDSVALKQEVEAVGYSRHLFVDAAFPNMAVGLSFNLKGNDGLVYTTAFIVSSASGEAVNVDTKDLQQIHDIRAIPWQLLSLAARIHEKGMGVASGKQTFERLYYNGRDVTHYKVENN